jgi:hypothetical protein
MRILEEEPIYNLVELTAHADAKKSRGNYGIVEITLFRYLGRTFLSYSIIYNFFLRSGCQFVLQISTAPRAEDRVLLRKAGP